MYSGKILFLFYLFFKFYNYILLQISIIHNCVSQFALLVVAYYTVRNTETVDTILLPNGHYFLREKPVVIMNRNEDKRFVLLESRIEFVFTMVIIIIIAVTVIHFYCYCRYHSLSLVLSVLFYRTSGKS